MSEIICKCGHSIYSHSERMPGCTARIDDDGQCECEKMPQTVAVEVIDALQAERDAIKEQLELVNHGLIACMLFLEEETVKGNSDAEIFLAGLTEKNIKAERDLLRQQLEVAKEALDKIADTSDNPKWMIADKARTEIAKLGEKK